MTTAQAHIGNLIADGIGRRAWIAAGMPTDLRRVTEIVLDARKRHFGSRGRKSRRKRIRLEKYSV